MVHNSELRVLIRGARPHPEVGPQPHFNDDLAAIHAVPPDGAFGPDKLLQISGRSELSGAELCDSSRNAENWSLAYLIC
jgi:hypothetical protein